MVTEKGVNLSSKLVAFQSGHDISCLFDCVDMLCNVRSRIYFCAEDYKQLKFCSRTEEGRGMLSYLGPFWPWLLLFQ